MNNLKDLKSSIELKFIAKYHTTRPNPVVSLLVFCKDRLAESWECGCSGWTGLMSYSMEALFYRLWQHMRVTWSCQIIKKKWIQ